MHIESNTILQSFDMKTLLDITLDAGSVALSYFKQDLEILRKSDGSKVSIADQETESVLLKGLKEISSFPIISEEDYEKNPVEAPDTPTYWLLDPIDGTSSFLEHKPEFTVNIGLIHNTYPILGIIYAPASDELYFTHQGKAFKKQQHAEPVELLLPQGRERNLRILLGHSTAKLAFMEQYLENISIESIHYLGSSLKFCKIAEGLFDLYPKMSRTKEWDTAAAQAILEAAGGHITDFHQQRLSYGKTQFQNPALKAFGRSDPLQPVRAK